MRDDCFVWVEISEMTCEPLRVIVHPAFEFAYSKTSSESWVQLVVVRVDKITCFVVQDHSGHVGPSPLVVHLVQDRGI